MGCICCRGGGGEEGWNTRVNLAGAPSRPGAPDQGLLLTLVYERVPGRCCSGAAMLRDLHRSHHCVDDCQCCGCLHWQVGTGSSGNGPLVELPYQHTLQAADASGLQTASPRFGRRFGCGVQVDATSTNCSHLDSEWMVVPWHQRRHRAVVFSTQRPPHPLWPAGIG